MRSQSEVYGKREFDINATVDDRRCAETKCRHGQISDLTGGENAVKSELSAVALSENKQQAKKLYAFTLAEILLSLTIIGIVAAIALPFLLGNAQERAWETQKKALYTRFSQALPLLPSLNGYGQLEGTLSSNSDDGKQHVDVDTAAESFIRDGLSKVMKITNICDSEHLTDCGLPDKIISIKGSNTIELSKINSIVKFNTYLNKYEWEGLGSFEFLDTKAAAYETVNGESIIVYYNPNCEPDLDEKDWHFVQPKMCANFIYDLNGKKGPNTVGKDIGFITALYSTDPIVVAPNPYPANLSGSIQRNQVSEKCKEMSADAKAPSVEEMTSIFYNMKLLNLPGGNYWTSSTYSGLTWAIGTGGGKKLMSAQGSQVRCIKR